MRRFKIQLFILSIACVTTIKSDHKSFSNNNVANTERNYLQQGEQFDEITCDFISTKVLEFAHNIGQELVKEQSEHLSKCMIFSPVSVMSVLSLVMLGAKGKSYQQLKKLFGFDNAALAYYPIKFHQEFGKMLEDLQENTEHQKHRRKNAYWRNTETIGYNVRLSKTPIRDEHVIKIANGLFSQTGYNTNPHYRHVVTNIYQSEQIILDFRKQLAEARNKINSWIAEKTFGKIPVIIGDEITADTNVVLASALYFKGFWENNFLDGLTKLQDFFRDGTQQPSIKVQMMSTAGVYPYYNSSEYDCSIIGLPYQHNSTTMYVIQPNFSSRIKLRELQKVLNAQKIEEIISKMSKHSAILTFPKLHFTNKIKMKSLLQSLDVTDVFTKGLSDLSLLGKSSNYTETPAHLPLPTKTFQPRPGQTNNTNANRQSAFPLIEMNEYSLEYLESQRFIPDNYQSELFVSDIIHKVDFEVNEHGTEAAAATVATISHSGPDLIYRADAPFLLLIRHDLTKLVLFYGIIEEPVF